MVKPIDDIILNTISNHPDYKLLSRVPESYRYRKASDERIFITTIIDLETMGRNALQDEIIEIGLLSFSFSNQSGILDVCETYNELNEPKLPIPEEITKITGITDMDVKGKTIDWNEISRLLKQSHLIICHNSQFDRNFLELQTNTEVKVIVENKPFACTFKDINWKERGFESSKLDYLNFKLGYFYEGHRALVDCWATFNLLIQEAGAFDELKNNVRKKEILICATNAAFEKKDLLKNRKYRWSDGTKTLPKCWWTTISDELLEEEKIWLDNEIYQRYGAFNQLPTLEISAYNRYSFRAESLS